MHWRWLCLSIRCSGTGSGCYIIEATMKSIVCLSSSVRAACHRTSACFPLSRLALCSPVSTCSNVEFTSRPVVAQPCVTGARTFHGTHGNTAVVQQVSATRLPTPVLIPGQREDELIACQIGRRVPPKAAATPSTHLSPYRPHIKPPSNAAPPANDQSLFEGEVVPELCSRLADLPSTDRAEALATLLGACVEFGLDPRSPLVCRLMNECLQLLSSRDIGVTQLCYLGEVACALEGRQSATVKQVLNSIGVAVEEEAISPSETARVYSLLALCYNPASQQQTLILSNLHRHTQRLVRRLKAGQVCDILQVLLKLQQRQVGRAATSQLLFDLSPRMDTMHALLSLGAPPSNRFLYSDKFRL